MRILNLTILTIFAGSVFLTSGKFVDATNASKAYFVLVFLFAMVITLMVRPKLINTTGFFDNKTLSSGIFMICFVQACYGLCQFIGWLPSNHTKFTVTGSFDNPAGFAAVLAMGFPIGLYLQAKTKEVGRYLASAILVAIATAVFLSGSRTGMLAVVASSAVFLLFKANVISKLRQLRYYKLLSILILICFVFGASVLYRQKKDSLNGRVLIWKVSSEMIKDKPIFGHGYEAFQAKYMDYQAEYFKNNPNSKFELLADNVKHPFNEFIMVAVEFGLSGLVTIFSFILFVLWKIMKSKNEYGQLVLSGLASFLVFACFSYPLQYVAVWLLLAFYVSTSLPSKKIEIKNTPISIITRSAIVIACTFFMALTFMQIRAEIKWKTIAVSSLRGNTEEMLPEYEKLFSTSLRQNPFFLYNYGAELNIAGKFDKSVEILHECNKRFNDYDLQLLLADNYQKKGELKKAIEIYEHASYMVPCRLYPLYKRLEIYKEINMLYYAKLMANEIISKKVKVSSYTVDFIKEEAREYLERIK